jgi:competence protein ComEA
MGGKTVERLQAEGLTIGPGGTPAAVAGAGAKPAAGAVVVKK